MNSEIPWLGLGIESADYALWETADPVFIKEKARVTVTSEW